MSVSAVNELSFALCKVMSMLGPPVGNDMVMRPDHLMHSTAITVTMPI